MIHEVMPERLTLVRLTGLESMRLEAGVDVFAWALL